MDQKPDKTNQILESIRTRCTTYESISINKLGKEARAQAWEMVVADLQMILELAATYATSYTLLKEMQMEDLGDLQTRISSFSDDDFENQLREKLN